MLKELFENAARIIAESARSPLGIAALLIIAGSVLAVLLFADSSDVRFKALIFVFIISSFLLLAKYAFQHGSTNIDKSSVEESAQDVDEEIVLAAFPDNVEWVDSFGKRYSLSSAEVCLLERLRGKPDVNWTKDLLLSAALRKTEQHKNEVLQGLDSLIRQGYLKEKESNQIDIMPVTVEYFRTTSEPAVHEIDETKYWDGT